jgi:hypothetical protein
MDKVIHSGPCTERIGGQSPEEVRITSGVPQGSILGPLLFPADANDIWSNTESTIRLLAGYYIIYMKIANNDDMENLQIELNRLGEWGEDF